MLYSMEVMAKSGNFRIKMGSLMIMRMNLLKPLVKLNLKLKLVEVLVLLVLPGFFCEIGNCCGIKGEIPVALSLHVENFSIFIKKCAFFFKGVEKKFALWFV